MLFGVFTWLVAGCNVQSQGEEKSSAAYHEPFIFNMGHYFLDDELNLSFPIWFNDSIIKLRHIKKLTRTVYVASTKDDTLKIPEQVYHYYFNIDGGLKEMQVIHYYDNQLMGEMSYSFKGMDEFGFAIAVPQKKAKSEEEFEILANYPIVEKEEYRQKYLVFRNSDGNRLLFMLKEKNWGPLTIDSILNPDPNDRIVLGTPFSPVKKYNVDNRVNESNVVEYKYDGNDVVGINYYKYPFSYRRSILYNGGSECIGFVDSTFSDNEYLTRQESMFHMEEGLPVRLIHENKSDKSEVGYYQFETFEYEYFVPAE